MRSILRVKGRLWLGVLAVAIALLQCQPTFAQGITADELKHSLWDTTYMTASGGRVRATVVLDGEDGYYDIPGARGRLSNVQYRIDTAGVGGGSRKWAAQITGNWSLGGSRGSFSFQSDSGSPIQFEGNWRFSNGSGNGTWNGRLVRAIADGGGAGGGPTDVSYGPWQQTAKGNYYRVCKFPAGGYQFLILFPSKPQWVYWYNPEKQVFWCCCPTIRHPDFGNDAANGVDQFLIATTKSSAIEDAEFPDDAGPNFRNTATAKDKNGQDVTLGCPPPDLPPGM